MNSNTRRGTIVLTMVVVVMGIALRVLALRSADKEAPPTVDRTGIRSTLESSQLTDADDLFGIKPVLAYFRYVWNDLDANLNHSEWTADLDEYIQIVEDGPPYEFDATRKTIYFYLASNPGFQTDSNDGAERATGPQRRFVAEVRRFLAAAVAFVAANGRAYEARVVAAGLGEVRRFEATEVASWAAMLDGIDARMERFEALALGAPAGFQASFWAHVQRSLAAAGGEAEPPPSGEPSGEARALWGSALFEGLVLAEGVADDAWSALFD